MEREIRNDERELGEAIDLGAQKRPRQSFGSYYEGQQASCALGAAYDGIYRIPSEATPAVYRDLYRLFDCLDFTIKWCPVGCKKQIPLAALIVHLNDDHQWSREQIADWLRSVGAH